MNRIEKKFKALKKKGRKAFIAFITAGYPDAATTYKLILEFAEAGVDIIELGIPFTDPMADGPVIQEASQKALEKKINLPHVFEIVRRARRFTDMPICLMTYYNPIFCFGEKKFVKQAVSAGVDGVIVPDLPPEEGKQLIRFAKESGLDTIFFVSPTTTLQRARAIASSATGFIYYVSLTGVTGARKKLPLGLKESITAVKRITRKPVCVGFGIGNPAQVKEVFAFADGAIIGSAIVKKIRDNIGRKGLVKKSGDFIRWLKGGNV